MSTQIRDTGWMQWLYLGLALAALVGTTAQVTAYLGAGFVQGTINFWKETVVTLVVRSVARAGCEDGGSRMKERRAFLVRSTHR